MKNMTIKDVFFIISLSFAIIFFGSMFVVFLIVLCISIGILILYQYFHNLIFSCIKKRYCL
jgi:hypothetical protein